MTRAALDSAPGSSGEGRGIARSDEIVRGVALALATSIAIGFTYTDQAALVPLLRAELGLTEAQVGLFPTALFVVSAFSMLTLGTAVDRVGPLRVNAVALLCASLGNGLFAISPTFEWLLVSKALAGLAGGIGFVAGIRYITALYGNNRPHLGQGIYGAGYPFGSALGIAVMPPLAALAGGWREAFVASTVVLFTVPCLWLAFAPRVRRLPSKRTDIRSAMRNGNVLWAAAQNAAGFGLLITAGSWISLFLLEEFDLSIVAAGFVGSLLPLTGVVTQPLGGWLISSERIRTLSIMRLSQACNVLGLLLIASPGRPLLAALLGVALLGTGMALSYAAVLNTAAASLPQAPAAAQSLVGIGGGIVSIVGPPLMGVLVQNFGFSAAWFTITLVPAIALVGTFLMRGEESFARA